MKTKLLLQISTLFLIASTPALAQTGNGQYAMPDSSQLPAMESNNPDTPDVPSVTGRAIERGIADTKKAIADVTAGATDPMRNTYEHVNAVLIDGNIDRSAVVHVSLDTRMTAKGMLGRFVSDENGKSLGTVKDIILSDDGRAETVVVSHGGFLGIGAKDAAFDYDLIMNQGIDGDMIMPMTKTTIDSAQAFSYDPADVDAMTRAMPMDGISAKELLKGSLLDNNGRTAAWTDNLFFKSGYASSVIFKSTGMQDEKIVMDYRSLGLARIGGEYKFKMSARQTQQFEEFRKTASN